MLTDVDAVAAVQSYERVELRVTEPAPKCEYTPLVERCRG